MRTFNAVGAATNQILYNIVTTGRLSIGSIRGAMALAGEADDLRWKQRKDDIESARLQRQYNELYFQASDQTKTAAERYSLLSQAIAVHNREMDVALENAKEDLMLAKKQVEQTPQNTKAIDAYRNALIAVEEVESRRVSEIRRLQSQSTGIIKGEFEGIKDAINRSVESY